MKQITALLLAVVMLFLVGCSGASTTEKKAETNVEQSTKVEQTETKAEQTETKVETKEETKNEAAQPAGTGKYIDSMKPVKNVDLSLGTNVSTGTWYVLGNGMAPIWNEFNKADGITVYPVSTAGGQENAQMLASGEIELAYIGSVVAQYCYLGTHNQPNVNLRALTSVQDSAIQAVLFSKFAETGTIYDLNGKNININTPGSSGELYYEILNKALGIEAASLEHVNTKTAGEMMKNGEQIQGGTFDGGAPVTALSDLAATSNLDITILSFKQEDVDKMNTITPGVWNLLPIPGGTYEGFPNDILTAQAKNMIVCTPELDEYIVYKILEATYDETTIDAIRAVHAGNRNMSLQNGVKGCAVPLHVGAVKFYLDHGIEVDPSLYPPEWKNN